VIRCYNSYRRNLCEELAGQVEGGSGRQRCANAEARNAIAQSLLGAAEPLGEECNWHVGEFAAEPLEAHHQRVSGEYRIDRQR
jgi:hypothetical protein